MTTTTISKGYDGWNAETKVALGISKFDDWKKVDMPLMLTISTRKMSNGNLFSHADVHAEHNGSIIMELAGDYRLILERTKDRCTEKAVRAMHARAVARMPEVIAKATAFYAEKAARVA